jgi:hypothetical protein
MRKALLVAWLVGMLVPGVVLCSEGYEGSHHANPAVKEYVKQHVMPALLQKRQLLEAELTPEEKSTIAECRATLKQLHEQHSQEMGNGNWQEHEAGTPQQHAENPAFAAAHQQMKEVMDKLETIAAKHSNTLGNIKTDLEPARKQWQADIQKLTARSENESENQGAVPHYQHHGGDFMSFLGGHFHHAAARFLLIPVPAAGQTTSLGSDDAGLGLVESEATRETTAGAAASLTAFQVFPNPASNEIITGSASIPADNLLTILDMQGNVVMTQQNVQASQHLDVSQLQPGNYVVQIKGGAETVNQKLVISR